MKLLSLFSGIGAFEKALTNIGVDYELVGFSEIDKYAIQSYCAIHGVSEDLNLGDISKIKNENLPKNIDLITYGFPCQDLSIAGNLKGIKEGTRSGLLYEAERVIKETKPKYAIAENVKNLVSRSFINDFNSLIDRLDNYGYNSYYGVLNSNAFGLPQSRERVFLVSIRKDVDNGCFEFPIMENPSYIPLELFVDKNETNRPCKTNLKKYFNENYFLKYKSNNGIIKLFDGVSQGFYKSSFSDNRIYSIKGLCPTLTTRNNHHFYEIGGKLTPKESLRIMGFTDQDYNRILTTGISNSQIYKQAGNSVAVPVIEVILKQILKIKGDDKHEFK